MASTTIPTLILCGECGRTYTPLASGLGYVCTTPECEHEIGHEDVHVEADEHIVLIESADDGGKRLAYVSAATTWSQHGVRQMRKADAVVGAHVATPEYGPLVLTHVYPDADIAMAQFAIPADPGGLITYALVLN